MRGSNLWKGRACAVMFPWKDAGRAQDSCSGVVFLFPVRAGMEMIREFVRRCPDVVSPCVRR